MKMDDNHLQLRHTAAAAAAAAAAADNSSINTAASRRIREDLQNVVRMSFSPLVASSSQQQQAMQSADWSTASRGVAAANQSASSWASFLSSAPTASPSSSSGSPPPLIMQSGGGASLQAALNPLSSSSPAAAAASAAAAPHSNSFVVNMTNAGISIPYFGQMTHANAATAEALSASDVETGLPLPQPHTTQLSQQAGVGDGEPPPGAAAAAAPNADNNNNNDSVASTITQILSQNPELRQTLAAFEKYIPFVLLLAVKAFFDHGTGLGVFLGLFVTSFHSNSVVTQQVARQAKRNIWALFAVTTNLLACILFIYFGFRDDKLYLSAIFLPPDKVDSLYDLLWIVLVNDFILKFLAVIVKISIILAPVALLPFQKRGKYFLFVERSSQMHRALCPIQAWLIYLLDSYERIPGKVLGVILTAAYMVAKGKLLLKAAKKWRLAFSKMLQSTRYGKSPSEDQMKAVGGFCPICHDSYCEPTMLHCKHIFCEECVSTWFDRERTCPMCRAQVTEDPAWRDGATSQFLQLF